MAEREDRERGRDETDRERERDERDTETRRETYTQRHTHRETKRQRVSRACDQCRAAREKCDGLQPLCHRCLAQNRSCTYAAPPKKRGVQVGYIRSLETALAWVFDQTDGAEDALAAVLARDTPSKDADRLHKRWRSSKVRREIGRLLETGGRGGTTAASPRDKSESGVDTPADDCLQLPANHWRLLDVYFSYTHCWFPILDKQDALKTVYLYRVDGLPRSGLETTAAHAELWAVLALASFQDAASRDVEPDMQPMALYAIARQLIPAEDGPFQPQHAKALLLLALVNLGRQQYTAAWMLLGQARQIAAEADNDSPDRATTALLVGCSMLETLVSLRNKPTATANSSSSSNNNNNSTLPEDELDEWQPWAPCSGFGDGVGPLCDARTPAHALTTFNQIADVLALLWRTDAEDPAAQIHRVLRPELPFGVFVHAAIRPDSSWLTSPANSRVPSAHILRSLCLWVHALLLLARPTDETALAHVLTRLLASLEQSLALFGACGAPPLLLACLAALANRRCLENRPDRDRWQALQERLAAVWGSAGLRQQPQPQPQPPQHQHQHTYPHFPSIPLESRPQMPYVALDYDALLDDLTSIDYTDRSGADLQPQFMANLGFIAPGCDMPEGLDFDSVLPSSG